VTDIMLAETGPSGMNCACIQYPEWINYIPATLKSWYHWPAWVL